MGGGARLEGVAAPVEAQRCGSHKARHVRTALPNSKEVALARPLPQRLVRLYPRRLASVVRQKFHDIRWRDSLGGALGIGPRSFPNLWYSIWC